MRNEPDERAAGFQNISRSVIEKTLILFFFPSEINGLFHVRNVEVSLDIAFVKTDGALQLLSACRHFSLL